MKLQSLREVVALWEKAKALEALEQGITDACTKVGIEGPFANSAEALDTLLHAYRCELKRNEELVRQYETPLSVTALANIAFDATNIGLDWEFSSQDLDDRRAEWIAEALAVIQAIDSAMQRLPKPRLRRLFLRTRSLRDFAVEAFREAVGDRD